MKNVLGEVMREFYEFGVPDDVKPRDVFFPEKKGSATVVTGMRRTGKTYVTYQRMKALLDSGVPIQRIVHVNFDDDRLKNLSIEHLRLIGDIHAEMFPDAAREKCWYFLDELQDVEGWELYARRLLDSRLVQLCLTGSSSKLLSREIATQMRGRALDAEVFPLSFPEFLRFNSIADGDIREPFSSRTAGMLRNAMSRYLDEGGFPDVQGDAPRIRLKTLQEYADAVLYRDVIERHCVHDSQSLGYTLDYIQDNFAHKISTRAIAAVLAQAGVSANRSAISEYLDWLEEAYLVHRVSLRTDSPAVRRTNPDKYYFVDTGLAKATTSKLDEAKGWLLENLVFLSLRRRGDAVEYYNTRKGAEVDFFATDRLSKRSRLLQVAWDMTSDTTRKREIDALKDARAETGVDDCIIVTWDDEEEIDGIEIVPAWKWYLR